jgi:Stress responsive A/B Barrel Domain
MTYRLPTLAAVVLTLAASPAVRAEDKKADAHPFVHTVIFYLKADAPSGAADDIVADCHSMLAKIPTVKLLRAGKPAESSGGPTKKDYAVGLMILFDDAEGFKTYAGHQLHKDFVAKHLKYFDTSKLAAYDFANEKK